MCVKENFKITVYGMSTWDPSTCLNKFLTKICNRILKVTLCELLWLILVSFSLIILCTWKNEEEKEIEVDDEDDTSEKPVILWWTNSFPGTSETRVCPGKIKCQVLTRQNESIPSNVEAYLFYASSINFDDLPLPRRPTKIIWGLYHEESPRNVEEFMHDEALRLFNFSSTFSRYSDVPFPLQFLDSPDDITSTKYFVPTATKNSLRTEYAPVMYLQTDCETATERDLYVQELMKYISIDSYGSCLTNIELDREFAVDYLNKLNDDNFLNFVAKYKFVLALENGVCEDYVTEKFWRAIKVGVVPIYFGSPSIRDWLPNNKSAILLEDYPTLESMRDYLNKLLDDDNLYETHLTHKTRGIVSNKRIRAEFEGREYQTDPLKIAEKFECLICKTLYDRRKGIKKVNIVNKNHYNCPEPISALTLNVNPENHWVYSYLMAKRKAKNIYRKVMGSN